MERALEYGCLLATALGLTLGRTAAAAAAAPSIKLRVVVALRPLLPPPLPASTAVQLRTASSCSLPSSSGHDPCCSHRLHSRRHCAPAGTGTAVPFPRLPPKMPVACWPQAGRPANYYSYPCITLSASSQQVRPHFFPVIATPSASILYSRSPRVVPLACYLFLRYPTNVSPAACNAQKFSRCLPVGHLRLGGTAGLTAVSMPPRWRGDICPPALRCAHESRARRCVVSCNFHLCGN